MTALTRFFFRHDVTCRTPASIIGWWESRRLPYNIAVGATGLVTLTLMHVLTRTPPGPIPLPLGLSAFGALLYGIMANVCYTSGWMAEILIRRGSGSELEPVGPALFRYGLAFSIGLTLFPAVLMAGWKLLRVLDWLGAF